MTSENYSARTHTKAINGRSHGRMLFYVSFVSFQVRQCADPEAGGSP